MQTAPAPAWKPPGANGVAPDPGTRFTSSYIHFSIRSTSWWPDDLLLTW